MISAILSIIATILPRVMELFDPEAKRRRENEAFDKAIANTDAAAISSLLSQRFDRVRTPTGSYPGQP